MIEIFSPAKINLTLDVKPKASESDFHQLETIYHKLNWGDHLTIEKSETFEIHGDFDCTTEQNLIYKAWQCLDNPMPVKVSVIKNIPSGAGLGGGSSNAAHFVLGYYQLFNLGAIPAKLTNALSDLGKDIPFFMQPDVCALGSHYGETITPLDFNFSGQTIYLYFPPFKSNTAEAYGQLRKFDTNFTQKFLQQPQLENCGNTFQQTLEQNNYSELVLTGSGSTLYNFKKTNTPEYNIIETQLL